MRSLSAQNAHFMQKRHFVHIELREEPNWKAMGQAEGEAKLEGGGLR